MPNLPKLLQRRPVAPPVDPESRARLEKRLASLRNIGEPDGGEGQDGTQSGPGAGSTAIALAGPESDGTEDDEPDEPGDESLHESSAADLAEAAIRSAEAAEYAEAWAAVGPTVFVTGGPAGTAQAGVEPESSPVVDEVEVGDADEVEAGPVDPVETTPAVDEWTPAATDNQVEEPAVAHADSVAEGAVDDAPGEPPSVAPDPITVPSVPAFDMPEEAVATLVTADSVLVGTGIDESRPKRGWRATIRRAATRARPQPGTTRAPDPKPPRLKAARPKPRRSMVARSDAKDLAAAPAAPDAVALDEIALQTAALELDAQGLTFAEQTPEVEASVPAPIEATEHESAPEDAAAPAVKVVRTRPTPAPRSRPGGGGGTRPAVVAASCPYCAEPLAETPTISGRCPRCRQRILVRRVGDRTVLLTEAALPVFQAQRRQAVHAPRWTRERDRWLDQARRSGATPERIARIAHDPLSDDVVTRARSLYVGTMETAARQARRDRRWDEATRLSLELAATLDRLGRSVRPVPAEILAFHRDGLASTLRGIAEIARSAELRAATCCDACRGDDGRTTRIADELRVPTLPHEACPKGLCRCRWYLADRDRTIVTGLLRRQTRPPRPRATADAGDAHA